MGVEVNQSRARTERTRDNTRFCENPAHRSTALILASRNGHEDCVRQLLEWFADVEIRDNDDESALDVACMNGHKDCVKELLDAEANVDSQNRLGQTL